MTLPSAEDDPNYIRAGLLFCLTITLSLIVQDSTCFPPVRISRVWRIYFIISRRMVFVNGKKQKT